MATPITQYSVPMGYPANGLPAPTYPSVPQAKWPTPNYPAIATQSVAPYGYPYNMSAPRSTPNQFGPQGGFSPGYNPYAFNAPPQYFQQPYPQASQPIIQYIPVVRQPVKPPEASSPPILNPPVANPQPEAPPQAPSIKESPGKAPSQPKAIIPAETAPAEEEGVQTLESPKQSSPASKTNASKKPTPAGFAEETGDRVGAWVTGFLKEHPEWENKIKQFDLPSHLDTLGQGLATGQMPDMLKSVRDQFNQSWLLRHALPWLEKPLLAMCPFEYRIPLTQFFKWLKQKPDKA